MAPIKKPPLNGGLDLIRCGSKPARSLRLERVLAVAATIAHHTVFKNMTLTLMVFVGHLCGYDFTDICNRRHADNVGNVEVSGVSVLFNRRLLLGYLNFVSNSQC